MTATILIILAGVGCVVGGVLVLRLHAFLALILAALLVALLTSDSAVERFTISEAALHRVRSPKSEVTTGQLIVETGNGKPSQSPKDRVEGVLIGAGYQLLRVDIKSDRYQAIATLKVEALRPTISGKSEVALLIPTDSSFDLNELQRGDLVIDPVAFRDARQQAAKQTIGARVAQGFGNTCVSIGILIAMASIIGKCLLDSGAADRIVRTMLSRFGEPGAPAAFGLSGFLLGIPVFFDTVFYLMIPLGKAMRLRTGRNYLLYVLTIVCGGTMAHSLVPPTPGPLFVAEQLGVPIGTMILGGLIVGLATTTFGYLYAVYLNRHNELPLRESPDFSLDELKQAETDTVDESQLPSFWLAILPVVLPVVLIAGLTIIKKLALWNDLSPGVKGLLETLGEKNVALVIATLVAMFTLIRVKRQTFAALAESVQKALASGGVIILITAAGGAFGTVLRQTGVASLITDLETTSPQILCIAAFLITAAIRTAQGSATVAMITSVGILSGLAEGGGLGFHPLYLALAIGCGSKPISWMNDSGFWVVTRMSGMNEQEGLRYVTPLIAGMGVVGLGVVLIGVTLWPTF